MPLRFDGPQLIKYYYDSSQCCARNKQIGNYCFYALVIRAPPLLFFLLALPTLKPIQFMKLTYIMCELLGFGPFLGTIVLDLLCAPTSWPPGGVFIVYSHISWAIP